MRVRPGHRTPAVRLEVELTFEGLVDRLDPLAYVAEVAVGVGLVAEELGLPHWWLNEQASTGLRGSAASPEHLLR
jgi:hypothetical protein